MSANPIFPANIKTKLAQLQNSDGSTFVDFVSAAGAGTKIESIAASNSDTGNAYVVQLAVQSGGVDYVIGEVTVPAGAGTDGATAAVDLMSVGAMPWIRDDGVKPHLYLALGDVLRARVKTTITAGKAVQLYAQGADY